MQTEEPQAGVSERGAATGAASVGPGGPLTGCAVSEVDGSTCTAEGIVSLGVAAAASGCPATGPGRRTVVWFFEGRINHWNHLNL